MKIDCSITENYLREKARMTKNCCISCYQCPLSSHKNKTMIDCGKLESEHQSEAIAIIQKWSDEHPVMTNKEKFVQIMKDVFGANIVVNKGDCPPTDSYLEECNERCSKCLKWWDELCKEPEKKEG